VDPTPSAPTPARSSPLEHFRAQTPRLRLHPLENLLLWVVSAHLIFLPWALGAMKFWAQALSLLFALAGFFIALAPRNYTEQFTASGNFRLLTWPKLVRFPVFWAGLLVLIYIVVQGLNPAWAYVNDPRGWWMEPRPHVGWLPSGTEGPFFFGGGPWRTLIVYASAWLVVCSIWIGFTRRRTAQLFVTALAANGFALAVFALVQRLTTRTRMFWFWQPPNDSFFGSFIYKNHAGAYFILMLALSTGLAAWYYLRGLRRMEKSNPAGLFVFFAAFIAIDIIVSYARGATITMLVFLTVALVVFLVFQLRNPELLRKPAVIALLLIGFVFFFGTSYRALSAGQAWDRMETLLSARDTSIRSRQLATAATWDMVKDYPWLGAGAGSFRYLFPFYQQRYPAIYTENGTRLYWEHAHNDFVEIPAELGLFGVAIILFCGGYWLVKLVRAFFWDNPLSLLVCAGGLALVAHSWTDFLFQNPAVLLTWCAFWPAIVLWTEYEELNLRG